MVKMHFKAVSEIKIFVVNPRFHLLTERGEVTREDPEPWRIWRGSVKRNRLRFLVFPTLIERYRRSAIMSVKGLLNVGVPIIIIHAFFSS